MIVYRIGSARYAVNDGTGASRYGGRWNHKGTPAIYCAETRALCALEILANSEALGADYVVTAVQIPDGVSITKIEVSDLPQGWDSPEATRATRDLGTDWARKLGTAVLSVPSAIIPSGNYILNPSHPAFAFIGFSTPERFNFDDRLGRATRKT